MKPGSAHDAESARFRAAAGQLMSPGEKRLFAKLLTLEARGDVLALWLSDECGRSRGAKDGAAWFCEPTGMSVRDPNDRGSLRKYPWRRVLGELKTITAGA